MFARSIGIAAAAERELGTPLLPRSIVRLLKQFHPTYLDYLRLHRLALHSVTFCTRTRTHSNFDQLKTDLQRTLALMRGHRLDTIKRRAEQRAQRDDPSANPLAPEILDDLAANEQHKKARAATRRKKGDKNKATTGYRMSVLERNRSKATLAANVLETGFLQSRNDIGCRVRKSNKTKTATRRRSTKHQLKYEHKKQMKKSQAEVRAGSISAFVSTLWLEVGLGPRRRGPSSLQKKVDNYSELMQAAKASGYDVAPSWWGEYRMKVEAAGGRSLEAW